MTNQKPGPPEGAMARNAEDDVEGHRFKARVDGSEDDVEGHRRGSFPKADGSEDDVEGHRRG